MLYWLKAKTHGETEDLIYTRTIYLYNVVLALKENSKVRNGECTPKAIKCLSMCKKVTKVFSSLNAREENDAIILSLYCLRGNSNIIFDLVFKNIL